MVWILSVLVVSSALESDGVIPIRQPTTITQSGKYRLTQNITATSSPAILVQAPPIPAFYAARFRVASPWRARERL